MSDSQRPHGLQPSRLLHPWDFLGKSTGVGCREPQFTDCEAVATAAPSASRLPSPHVPWEHAVPIEPRVGSSGFHLLLTPVTKSFTTPRPSHSLPAEISQHPSLIPFLAFIRISRRHKKKSYPLLNTGGYKARSSGLTGALVQGTSTTCEQRMHEASRQFWGWKHKYGRTKSAFKNWQPLKKYR